MSGLVLCTLMVRPSWLYNNIQLLKNVNHFYLGLLYPTREAVWNRVDGVVRNESGVRQSPYKMSFNDLMNSKYYPEYFNGTWISDTEIVYLDKVSITRFLSYLSDNWLQFGDLSIYNVATSQIQTVLRNLEYPMYMNYEFSADRLVQFETLLLSSFANGFLFSKLHLFRKYLLVQTSSQKVWSRSTLGTYGLVRLQGGIRAASRILPLVPPNVS